MNVQQRCRELLDIESVSKNEALVDSYIRNALPSSLSITYDHDTVLFAVPPRRAGRQLVVIAGHTDTVPINNNFPSRTESSIIYGRGASDMKSGVAVMVELARWIHENNIETQFDLGFLFFGREELDAKQCPLEDALNDPAFAGVDLAILMEPTDNALEAGCVGNLHITLEFAGVAAHSARPWQGENAVHKAVVALNEFAQREPVPVEIDGLTFYEVANITQIRGGLALNIIPPLFEADVNIRYGPHRNSEQIEADWISYFEGLGAKATAFSNARSAPVVLNHPLVKQLQNAGVTKVQPKQAWTNAADFAHHGVAAINFGPGDPFYAHKEDEQVSVAALEESLAVLKRFVTGEQP